MACKFIIVTRRFARCWAVETHVFETTLSLQALILKDNAFNPALVVVWWIFEGKTSKTFKKAIRTRGTSCIMLVLNAPKWESRIEKRWQFNGTFLMVRLVAKTYGRLKSLRQIRLAGLIPSKTKRWDDETQTIRVALGPITYVRFPTWDYRLAVLHTASHPHFSVGPHGDRAWQPPSGERKLHQILFPALVCGKPSHPQRGCYRLNI